MINQLRKIYSSLIEYREEEGNLDENYKWFVTTQNEIIGIHEEQLTCKRSLIT